MPHYGLQFLRASFKNDLKVNFVIYEALLLVYELPHYLGRSYISPSRPKGTIFSSGHNLTDSSLLNFLGIDVSMVTPVPLSNSGVRNLSKM